MVHMGFFSERSQKEYCDGGFEGGGVRDSAVRFNEVIKNVQGSVKQREIDIRKGSV